MYLFFPKIIGRIDSGVAVIWGPPDYGDPRPHIARDIGTGVTISLSDMGTPQVPITLVVWGSSVIWGSLTKATVSLSNQTFDTSQQPLVNGYVVHKN